MSLVEFLEKNNIQYQPAKINVFKNSKGQTIKTTTISYVLILVLFTKLM